MEKNYSKIGIYIGRFQPLHNGHINIIKKGLDECDIFIVIIGSINKCDEKNPFCYDDRMKSIILVPELKHSLERLFVMGINDSNQLDPIENVNIDEVWYHHLSIGVNKFTKKYENKNVYLYGSVKDKYTEEYLSKIMSVLDIIEYVPVSVYTHNEKYIHSTDIREEYVMIKNMFEEYIEKISKVVPDSTVQLLKKKFINDA